MNNSSSKSLVHQRLQDVLIAHESSLSNVNLSSLEHRRLLKETKEEEEQQQQQQHTTTRNNNNNNDSNNNHSSLSLAQAALYRTTTTTFHNPQQNQPSTSSNDVLIDVNLNPPERVSPQDLFIHDQHHQQHHSPSNDVIRTTATAAAVAGRNEENGIHNVDLPSLTLKTITVLSTLCDEAHELYDIATLKLIPKIHLFGHDLKQDELIHRTGGIGTGVGDTNGTNPTTRSSNNNSNNNINTNNNHHNHHHHSSNNTTTYTNPSMNVLLDESILADRDSKLLHRMSKFITTLQSTQNYVQRCHRLIRNIVCQIHGCLSPIQLCHDDHDDVDGLFLTLNHSIDDGDEDYGDEKSGKSTSSVPKFIRNPFATTTTKTKTKTTNTTTSTQRKKEIPTLSPIFKQSNHLIMLGEALIKLLSILITIDSIIGQNFELQEAWDLYKSIITERAEKIEERVNDDYDNDNDYNDDANASLNDNSISDDRSSNNNDVKLDDHEYRNNLISLERMIMQIDFTLVSSRSFLICIEQNFDPRGRFCFNPVIQPPTKGSSWNKKNDNGGGGGGSSNDQRHNHQQKQKQQHTPKPLYEHIKNIVSVLYEWYCSVIHTNEESTERYDMVGIYGLYCLYRRLLPSNKEPDEKLHRALCTVFPSSYPIIPLFGTIGFMPIDFISKYAPLDTSSSSSRTSRTRAPKQSEIIHNARIVLGKFDKSFSRKVDLLYDEVMSWTISAESELAPLERGHNTVLFEDDVNQSTTDMILTPSDHQRSSYEMNVVTQKAEMIQKGMRIASQATILLRTFLFLHTYLGVNVEQGKHIHCIKRLCFIAKSIENVLGVRRRSCVVSMNKAILKILASSLYSCFDKLRSYIDQRSVDHGKDSSDQVHTSTISTSLWALESILKGTSTFSPSRRYAVEVAVYVCSQESFNCITNEDKKTIRNLMNQIKWMSEIDDKLNQVCDCSFLYFHRDLYPTIMKSLFTQSEYNEVEGIQLMMNAFSDAIKVLRSSSYFDPTFYKKRYCEYVIDHVFNEEFLQPLSFKIEASLRLLLFVKNLNEIKPVNPKEQRFGRFKKYIEMKPIQFCGIKVHVKKAVERYLEKSFYNFATVGLSDSKTYAEMATFGNELYGLNLIENNLPKENIPGVDFPEILNVSSFSKQYKYNMVQQNFIERKVNNGCKYIKTLGIETLSLSFQRHGLGMADTVYKEVQICLYRAVDSLMELFSNNLLRSFLSKESRWFKQQITNIPNANYPLDRAMKLRKEIGEISRNNNSEEEEEEGDDEEGGDGEDSSAGLLSILEQCRECVTLVGNVLGLARLVQSGKMYAINQAKTYSSSFEGYDKEDSILDEFTNQFRSDIRMMGERSSQEGGHNNAFELLENFYILFPALSLTWLDASIRGKDMLSKKYQTFDAYYTDDGFAVGAAFLLEVLDQSNSMDKLNWFESSCVAIASNRKNILESLKKSVNKVDNSKREKSTLFGTKAKEESKQGNNSNKEDELSRLRVTAKRLEVRKQEMELLHYTVLGARVFFTIS